MFEFACAVDWAEFFKVLQSASFIAIGVAGAAIAFQQANTQRKRLKMDLFDRRFAVYQAAKTAIGSAVTTGHVDQRSEFDYLVGTASAKWLFDEKLSKYLDKELWNLLQDLALQNAQQQPADLAGERRDTKGQLTDALRGLDAKFRKFLKLDH